jgi:hypothetical protein
MRFSIYMTERSKVEQMLPSKLERGAIEIAKAINSVQQDSVDYYACVDGDANHNMALLSEDIKVATLELTHSTFGNWHSHLKKVNKLLLDNCILTERASFKAKKNLAQAMELTANNKDFDTYCYLDSEINVLFQGDAIAVRDSYLNDLRNFYSFEDVWDK